MRKSKKTKKRQKLGEGFIWFSDDIFQGNRFGYSRVALTREGDGRGGRKMILVGKLGAWQKVRLYAEWD